MTDEELLEEYGEESAKTEYSRAMRLLEKLRNNALVVLKNGSENTVRNVKVSAKILMTGKNGNSLIEEFEIISDLKSGYPSFSAGYVVADSKVNNDQLRASDQDHIFQWEE